MFACVGHHSDEYSVGAAPFRSPSVVHFNPHDQCRRRQAYIVHLGGAGSVAIAVTIWGVRVGAGRKGYRAGAHKVQPNADGRTHPLP